MTDHLYDTRCAYGRNPDDPNPHCPKQATWHIALVALDMVSVNAVGACGVLWNFRENRCVLDDSGVEQASRELAEASA
jgi:hypothetical protein